VKVFFEWLFLFLINNRGLIEAEYQLVETIDLMNTIQPLKIALHLSIAWIRPF
jgi:hypothetical protein